jgi:fatty-acyl-CoA synthase
MVSGTGCDRAISAETGRQTVETEQVNMIMSATEALVPSCNESLVPTPNEDSLPRRLADFATFGEALDYAARGERGFNFHDPRGNLARVYPYSELREDALAAAYRLIASGIGRGDRVALIAETGPDFAALFCGAVYAGAWPVPLPLPTSFGGKDNYIDQIAVQMASAEPAMLLYPRELEAMAGAAAQRQGCIGLAWEDFAAREAPQVELPQLAPDDVCFLQYSSGSTRFPHGVVVTHRSLLANVAAHSHGMAFAPSDRCISWLPWYHDMGLVGCFLSMIANQVSADYLKTEDFARRPLAWLDLVSRNPGTSCSFSPTFGYDICARRVSSQTSVAERFDLTRWRIAGNGADMIRPDVMQNFVNAFAPAGFKASAFLPSYGLAEATLAVTIMPPGEGIRVELVEEERLSGAPRDLSRPARYRAIVNCGVPVRGMAVEIRGEGGQAVADHRIGKVWCRGTSLMQGYYRDPEATADCMQAGWLDTGDMGYLADGYLFIVGRAKDMIIINGKNHWPQDIEWAVEQLPGFHQGDIAAFAMETEQGEEVPAVLVHCRVSDPDERMRLHEQIRDKVRSVTGMNCLVELVPPRTLPRTSSGKLSRAKAKKLYLSGEIEPFKLAA